MGVSTAVGSSRMMMFAPRYSVLNFGRAASCHRKVAYGRVEVDVEMILVRKRLHARAGASVDDDFPGSLPR